MFRLKKKKREYISMCKFECVDFGHAFERSSHSNSHSVRENSCFSSVRRCELISYSSISDRSSGCKANHRVMIVMPSL